jgi:2-keto-4-pentenoate hydratase
MSYPTSDLVADGRVRRGLAAQLAARERILAAGATPVGWKLGFGAPAAMEKLGTSAPLTGFLTSRTLAGEGDVSIEGWANPLIEPEVAVRVERGAEGPRAATFAPALELADLDPPPDEVEAILAGNIFHRHVILGPETPSRGVDVRELTAEISVNDEATRVDDVEATTGEIGALIHHVADLLGELGPGLADGEVVICGSLVPPIALAAGDEVRYRLGELGSLEISARGATSAR